MARLLGACLSALAFAATVSSIDLVAARDRGDSSALDSYIKVAKASADKNNSPDSLYQLALAYSYGAEVAFEKHDKSKSEQLAEAGLDVARKAVSANDKNSEYHRLVGALCGQVIPATNPLMGALKYGSCARDEISRAIALDSRNALAYVSRGIGNYYLPAQMGGGPEAAIPDFDKAISLNPKLSEAYLWKGITLRKQHRDKDAHAALEEAVQLAPDRIWAKEQLAKTPAQ